jgi:hypothetical protein
MTDSPIRIAPSGAFLSGAAILDAAPQLMNWGCLTLNAAAAGSILTPWSKELVSGVPDTNKWIVTVRSGSLWRLRAKMRIPHTQDITFEININFVPTFGTTVLTGQTDAVGDIVFPVVAGVFVTASAVAADGLGAAFSMDVSAQLL